MKKCQQNDENHIRYCTPEENRIGARNYQQMIQLRQTAWNLKYAAIKTAHPDWSDERITDRVRENFLYVQRHDFF